METIDIIRQFDAQQTSKIAGRAPRSAQQRVATARGVSLAMKVGFGAGLLLVALVVAL